MDVSILLLIAALCVVVQSAVLWRLIVRLERLAAEYQSRLQVADNRDDERGRILQQITTN